MGLFMNDAQTGFDFTDIYTKLVVQIILPVVLGMMLQRFLGDFVQRYNSRLTLFDKSVILLIIYKSFAESFSENLFSSVSLLDLSTILLGVLVLFGIVFFITGWIAKRLGFSIEDRITAQFCGTKKSLVHGTVFSKILFGSMPALGLMLLPLMLFHAVQIMIISVIASRHQRRAV
jgi:sodium/bile acid cotransporter 7